MTAGQVAHSYHALSEAYDHGLKTGGICKCFYLDGRKLEGCFGDSHGLDDIQGGDGKHSDASTREISARVKRGGGRAARQSANSSYSGPASLLRDAHLSAARLISCHAIDLDALSFSMAGT